MKKILSALIAVLLPVTVSAQVTRQQAEDQLIGLGMPGPVANLVAGLGTGNGVVSNNTWQTARNAAGTANINVWEVDSSDNTRLNSSASDELILQLEDDAQRLISFTAASDTVLAMKFGDGGTTATQDLAIGSATADADDDGSGCLSGGGLTTGACDSTRGAYVRGFGNERSAVGGRLDLFTGAAASGQVLMLLRGDSQRLLTFDGSADAALAHYFGDGGTTAVQQYTVRGSTADADDDSTLLLTGAGAIAADGSRGGYISLAGEEVAGGGDITYVAGASDTHIFNVGAATALTVGTNVVGTGEITSSSTGSLGWSYVTGANTACTTTCTSAAVFGVDLAAGASQPVIVGPSSATADACVCAGAS